MAERRETVVVRADVSSLVTKFAEAGAATKAFGHELETSDSKMSGLVATGFALAPALVPIGALAVPAVAGLSAQLGFAAAAAGTALLAFHGLGGALKAMDTYQLQPTTANLSKMQIAMDKLGPAGQHFVRELDRLEPKLKSLKVAAENGLLPGAEEGITHLLTLLPQVRRIIGEVSGATGNLLADAGKNLAGPEFKSFFSYLENNAKPILTELGQTIGNFAAGFAHLFVGLAPLERDFSSFMLSAARGFDSWAAGLDKTQGFADFLDYIHQTGPEVGHALASIGNAFLKIAEAGAPLGGPILQALGAVADVVAKIADSEVGTPLVALAAGLGLVNRALAVSASLKGSQLGMILAGGPGAARGLQRTTAALGGLSTRVKTVRSDLGVMGTTFMTAGAQSERAASRMSESTSRLRSNLAGVGKGAAVLGGIAIASSGAADGIGLTNTASLALMGTMAGPWGTAIGGGIGLLLDAKSATDANTTATKQWQAALAGTDISKIKAQLPNINPNLPDLNKPGAPAVRGGGTVALAQQKQAEGLARINELSKVQGAKEGAANLHFLADGFIATDGATRQATMSTQAFETEVTRLNSTLSDRASLRDYQAALDDFRTGLAKVRKDMAGSGQKLIIGGKINIDAAGGRQAQQLLDNIAASALKVAQTLKGVDRVEFLHKARGQFIAAAEAIGIPDAAAKRLATRLLGLAGLKVNPKVDINTARADAKRKALQGALSQLGGMHPTPSVSLNDHATAVARQIQAAINGIHGKTVSINTLHNDSFISKRIQADAIRKSAAGGAIAGPGTGLQTEGSLLT